MRRIPACHRALENEAREIALIVAKDDPGTKPYEGRPVSHKTLVELRVIAKNVASDSDSKRVELLEQETNRACGSWSANWR